MFQSLTVPFALHDIVQTASSKSVFLLASFLESKKEREGDDGMILERNGMENKTKSND